MGDPIMESNHWESRLYTNTHHRHHRKREKDQLQIVRQHGKAWATNTLQDLPNKVTINSWLLDMQ
jgi:hypothetical protein